MDKKKKIFNYFTIYPNWKKQVLIGSLISLCFLISNSMVSKGNTMAIIGFPVYYICLFVLSGFEVRNANLRIFQPDKIVQFNFMRDIACGFKLFFGYVIIAFPFVLAAILLCSPVYQSIKNHIGVASNTLIAGIIAVFVLVLIYITLLILAIISYCMDLKFKSIFNFQRAYKMVKFNKKAFFKYVTELIAYSCIITIIAMLCAVTVIGIVLVPSIIFLMALIRSEITARYLRNTFKNNKSA